MINELNKTVNVIEEIPVHTDYNGDWEQYSVDMINKLKQLRPLSQEINTFISSLEKLILQLNDDISLRNEIKPVLLGAMNYKGTWSDSVENQDYPYSLNDSVSIGNDRYISKVDNNTDLPTSNENWLHLNELKNEDIGIKILAPNGDASQLKNLPPQGIFENSLFGGL